MKTGINRTAGTVIKYAIKGTGVILGLALVGFVYPEQRRRSTRINYWDENPPHRWKTYITYEYSDAVDAVMSSGMGDLYERETIQVIPVNADESLYKAIVSVAKSDYGTFYKMNMISDMCKNYKEAQK